MRSKKTGVLFAFRKFRMKRQGEITLYDYFMKRSKSDQERTESQDPSNPDGFHPGTSQESQTSPPSPGQSRLVVSDILKYKLRLFIITKLIT